MWPEVLHDLDCVLSTPEKFCKVFSLFTFLLHGIFRSSIFQKITVKG
jgi:hypothetical protein